MNSPRLLDFIPAYPDIANPEFENSLFEKREMYALAGTTQIDPVYLNSQLFLAQYLAPETMYDEILVRHSMGLGKTGCAIAVAERAFATPGSTITKAVVFFKNTTLVRTFLDQLVQFAPTKYAVDVSDALGASPDAKAALYERRLRHLVQKWYHLVTYDAFYNDYHCAHPRQLQLQFSNSVVVLDEVHRITNESRSYQFFHRFLHVLTNRKIMLMTGTPMTDAVAEIADVLNLILPLDAQLPTGTAFEARYLGPDHSFHHVDELERAFRGRVSFLNRIAGVCRYTYITETVHGGMQLPYLPTVQCTMDPVQERVYAQTYAVDHGWKRRALQASLFVFPNGMIENAGFHHYFRRARVGGKYVYTEKPEWTKHFWDPDPDVIVARIRQCSTKYARVLEYIRAHPTRKMFVYLESIHEGGAYVFASFLKLLGYDQARCHADQPRKRYLFLTSNQLQSKGLQSMLGFYNADQNRDGRYVQILIGGAEVGIGYTFKETLDVHVLLAHYNLSKIEQAIHRTIRVGAHADMSSIVKVHLYAAIALNTPSIDVEVYRQALQKDIFIRRMEYLLKRCAVDAAIHFERNQLPPHADARTALYMPATYRATGVTYPYTRELDTLNHGTCASETVSVDTVIVDVLRAANFVTLDQLRERGVTAVDAHHARARLVGTRLETGLIGFDVRVDAFFVQPIVDGIEMYGLDAFTDATYANISKRATDFERILDAHASQRITDRLHRLADPTIPPATRMQWVREFPLATQETLLEELVLGNVVTDISIEILQLYKPYLHEIGDAVYSVLLHHTQGIIRVLESGEWRDGDAGTAAWMLDVRQLVGGNPCGYYLRYEVRQQSYHLVQLTGTQADYTRAGQNLKSFRLVKLAGIARRLGIDTDSGESGTALIDAIVQFFEERGRVWSY